jgi:ABC-type lipoprotein export system ATPase subunit
MSKPVAVSDAQLGGAGLAMSCRGIRHVYRLAGRDVVALSRVDLEVPAGSSLAILGPSGSGKSTLLSVMAGLLRPTEGQLIIGSTDLATEPERRLISFRGRQLGVVVQNPTRNLLAYGTPEDNIAFAQRALPRRSRSGLRTAAELLGELGLESLSGRPVARLSGGEQQRLALAVALAAAPGLLLADEPTSQLDDVSRDRVIELLRRITERLGATVVAVTHDPVVADALVAAVSIDGGEVRPR